MGVIRPRSSYPFSGDDSPQAKTLPVREHLLPLQEREPTKYPRQSLVLSPAGNAWVLELSLVVVCAPTVVLCLGRLFTIFRSKSKVLEGVA